MIKALIKNRPLLNLLIYGIGQGFNLITPLLVIPYLTKICGESGLGKIGTGMAISFILIVVIDYGSDIIGVKNVSVNRDNKQELSKILSTAYASRLLLLALVIVLMLILYNFVPFLNKEKELYIFGLSILAAQCLSPVWVFQGLENFKAITIIIIISKIIYVAGVFYFVNAADDYVYVNLFWGIGMFVPYIVSFIYLSSVYNINAGNTSLKEVFSFISGYFAMFSSQLFMSLQMYIPILLISILIGDTMAGRYRIIDQVIVIFKTYIFLFFNYLYPRVCYLLERNAKEAMHFWRIYNLANFGFIVLCMCTLFFMADLVINYFTDDAVPEMANILRIAIVIPLVMAVSIPLKQLVLGKNYQKFYIKLTLVMVAFNILIMALLIPHFKLYGVFVSIIITEAVTTLLYTVVIKTKPGILN
jgi:O-antigen/teichoic acid export membrane protein